MDELLQYADLWTSEREQYILVRQPVGDGVWFFDLYRADGTYCTLPDATLNRLVAERMVAAGVREVEAEVWVRELTVQHLLKRLSRQADEFVIVRYREPDDGLELLYDVDANSFHIQEPEVRRLCLDFVAANGSDVVLLDRFEDGSDPEVLKQWNRLVARAHTEQPDRSDWICGVMAQHSFDPWSAWRLLRHENAPPAQRYSAELVYAHFGGPLPFREQVKAPPEQRWKYDLVRLSLPLTAEEGDELVRRLGAIRVPVWTGGTAAATGPLTR